MPLIGGRVEALALEHVAQVAAAVGAHNLGARHAERAVLVAHDGAGDRVEVRRPPAARLELVVGLVQRRRAPRAGVDALRGVVLVEGAGAGGLRALLAEDAELFFGVRVSDVISCGVSR